MSCLNGPAVPLTWAYLRSGIRQRVIEHVIRGLVVAAAVVQDADVIGHRPCAVSYTHLDRFGRLREGRLRHGPAQGESVCQGTGCRS